MIEEEKNVKELLDAIDKVELLPDEIVENMDFYQLSSYIQTLNMIDSLEQLNDSEGEE